MRPATRTLSLTPAHIKRVHGAVDDAGPPPGMELHNDAAYADWVERMIRSHPAPSQPTQLFAYGSLIWKPDMQFVSEQIGDARGWHRSFSFRVPHFRGTPDRPGSMMALDRGGHGLVDCDNPGRHGAAKRRVGMRQAQKKFEKLVKAHSDAVDARQEAAAQRATIKGVGGPGSDIDAIAYDIGTAVIETELALLRVERKALRRVHVFAQKHATLKKGE